MILSNDGLVAFHYRSYGTFFLHKIGSIISIGDLPTTNIIEPKKEPKMVSFFIIQISVRTHKPRIFLFMNLDRQDYDHASLFHVVPDEVSQESHHFHLHLRF